MTALSSEFASPDTLSTGMSTAGRADMTRPRIVGRYAIGEEIASGGMASVHFGRLVGPVAFTRTVAIKRLHEHLVDKEEARTRFLDEARLVARIRHPNVVPTLDVIAEGEEVFLVMEYVHGDSLSKLLRAARKEGVVLPVRVLAALVADALHGLHAAHEAKSDQGDPLMIVHRDVSPQNVLVGDDGAARVVDFGVAKATARAYTTLDKKIRGKLRYMAPEQITNADVDRRTDLYAMGVILWEGLTGRRMYQGLNDGELVTRVIQKVRPDPPSTVHVTPGLTEEQIESADMIVVRALAFEPADRFPSADAMAVSIEKNLPIATKGEVAEWVRSLLGSAMSERNARLTAFERIQIDPDDLEGVSLTSSRIQPIPTQLAPETETTDRQSRQPWMEDTGAKAAPKQGRARTALLLLAVLLGLVGGGIVIAMVAKRRSESTLVTPSATPVTSVSAPSAPTSVATAEPTTAPSASTLAVAPPASTRTGQRAPVGKPRPTASASAVAPPAPPPPPPDCDPPYTRDGNGLKIHKPQCMGVP
jgi:eukaryotic-like serine/threonine-protein kinase